ncbi:MAG: 30S ribosomal protein S8 [bacterium]
MIHTINLFTKIKNAQAVNKKSITVRNTKMIQRVLGILQKNNYIQKVSKKDNILIVELLYLEKNRPAISKINPISKPSLQIYRSYTDFKDFISSKGMLIVSTSKGLMTDKDAKNQRLGGKIICKVE